MTDHDSSLDRRLRPFEKMTGSYDNGEYAGASGWENLSYVLQLQFNLIGCPGAMMKGIITKDMVDHGADARTSAAHAAHEEALAHMQELSMVAQRQLRRLTSSTHRGLATRGEVDQKVGNSILSMQGPQQDVGGLRNPRGDVDNPGDPRGRSAAAVESRFTPRTSSGPNRLAGLGVGNVSTSVRTSQVSESKDETESAGAADALHLSPIRSDRAHPTAVGRGGASPQLDLTRDEREDAIDRRRLEDLLKAFTAQKAIIEEHERQQRVRRDTMVSSKQLFEMCRGTKTRESFLRLDLEQRRALFQYCNTFIANAMALVLGHEHQALLSLADADDGIGIINK